MRPRNLGKIACGVATVALLIVALIYAMESPNETGEMYKAFRGITYSIMALTFATLYRYFED